MSDLFDRDEYAAALKAKGLDPAQAAEIARRTSGARKSPLSQSGTADLFSGAAPAQLSVTTSPARESIAPAMPAPLRHE